MQYVTHKPFNFGDLDDFPSSGRGEVPVAIAAVKVYIWIHGACNQDTATVISQIVCWRHGSLVLFSAMDVVSYKKKLASERKREKGQSSRKTTVSSLNRRMHK